MRRAAALLTALLLPAAQAFSPSVTLLIRCPDGETLRRWAPGGGSVVNLWSWTDGSGLPPMRSQSVSRCSAEDKVYRVDAAEIDRHAGDTPVPAQWLALPKVEATTARDLAEALEAGLALSIDEERWWRRELWWAANAHLQRMAPPRNARNPFAPGQPAPQNLLCLLALLDPSDARQALERAELLRALELYGEALRQLERLPDGPEWYRSKAALIRSLAKRQDPLVRPTPSTLKEMRKAMRRGQAGMQPLAAP